MISMVDSREKRLCRIPLAAAFVTLMLNLIPIDCGTTHPVVFAADRPEAVRITTGQQVLYDFRNVEAGIVRDLSSNSPERNLKVQSSGNVTSAPSGVIVQGKSSIASEPAAGGLTTVLRHSQAFSIEAWVRPQSLAQSGPARLVTLSKNSSERNFTLGQDGDKLEFRLRTTATSGNGLPSLITKSGVVRNQLMHIVCTRSRPGVTRIFVDGQQVAEQSLQGDFSNWNNDFRLGIGNELSGDRPWEGLVCLVAIFDRDLSADEVRHNYHAGLPDAEAAVRVTKAETNARFFETDVAPILSRHCLECHDTSTRSGGLDLSIKERAFQGNAGGAVLVAGNASQSRLWQAIESDEMPHDRTPLSADQKRALKKWIDAGAEWSLATLDPANYVHGKGSQRLFVQRLTVPEYVASVRDLLGVDISRQANELLPADLRADGFSNTAYNLTVDLAHIEAYLNLAELIVQQIDATKLAARYTKSRELTDENLVKFIDPFGRLMLRGPLTPPERQSFLGVSTSVAAAGGDFEETVRYIVAAMLQSPRFLYRMENQRGNGASRPASSFELASRLSYSLWGGPPDEALLEVAEKDELSGEILRAQIDRMLADERTRRRSRQFISEWLNLNRLRHLRPAAVRFPDWSAELAEDMRAETLAFFEEVVWTEQRPMSALLNAQVTFVTPRLARFYRLPAPVNLDQTRPERLSLTHIPERGGLLTQGSILTVGGDDASTVTRGLFVMHELLRGVVDDPPPCVDTTPVPSRPGLTQRAIAEQRLDNASCTGCHAKFEPLSFGLEKFDGLGTFHEKDEYGNTLREDGTILFPGQAQPVHYRTSAELMNLLAESPRVQESLTWKMAQFAIGRPLGAEDAAVMAEITRKSQAAGGRWTDIMRAIAHSELILMTRTESDVDQ